MADLDSILRERFGFDSFRPHQREACETVASGRDCLLVMPTGAGKSLCYQLPAVARGGSALVISPLISLMEDQAGKLIEQGFSAARIHSGRPREESRQACFDWAEGKLDFLFIAPERLRVPGFVEWLAKRTPGLIAVDEAHCISQWGHDFRPDYRLLGQRLELLRGAERGQAPDGARPLSAPVIALTATATPMVQQDIVNQLQLVDGRKLIHGFRRTNLAIELVELKPSQRADAVCELLDGARASRPHESGPEVRDPLPAIVYVPSRKECEALAQQIAENVPCMPYHAGLTAAERDKAQAAFLAGDVSVIVATIAFGMGIDKHNVRTVIHTALPATVEGYYQEIGRAGRDGKPSRAILMWGWNDRRLHEWFLDRDYPPVNEMRALWNTLGRGSIDFESLANELELKPEVLSGRLDKLAAQGGAVLDADGFISQGGEDWIEPYENQRAHKEDQLDRILNFAQGNTCRMLALLNHFGDRDDMTPCGKCDVCAPQRCVLKTTREPDAQEMTVLAGIMERLLQRDNQSTGKLYRDNFEGAMKRGEFEDLLGALEQNGLVYTMQDEFEKDGRVIQFKRVSLTDAGRETGNQLDGAIVLTGAAPKKKSTKQAKQAAAKSAFKKAEAKAEPDPELVKTLKSWRLEQAKSEGVQAYRVFGNRTLNALAANKPKTRDELLDVPGIGPAKLEAYGDSILELLQG
ncbi:MAG: ATP-dependent DNA helicase RecQ [Planctomycetes bacterium]|nr:ATP-dependent DNA helicase RecQ [Planctomycetota bacterium]